jgi:hypothetical protein
MKIYLFGANAFNYNANDKYNSISEIFERKGHEIVRFPDKAELCIFVDAIIPRKFLKIIANKIKVAIIQEPEVVKPQLYKRSYLNNFDLVIGIGQLKDFNTEKVFVNLKWPQILSDKYLPRSEERTNRIVAIASKRISFVKNENYKFRFYIFNDKHRYSMVDFYGKNWEKNISHSLKDFLYSILYHGVSIKSFNLLFIFRYIFTGIDVQRCKDKKTILQKYKFSLVIENSTVHFTEKFFDALKNGTVPIYLGPGLNQLGIPKELYIDLSQFSFSKFDLNKLTKGFNYDDWLQKSRNYLGSDTFRKEWHADNIFNQLTTEIEQFYLRNMR